MTNSPPHEARAILQPTNRVKARKVFERYADRNLLGYVGAGMIGHASHIARPPLKRYALAVCVVCANSSGVAVCAPSLSGYRTNQGATQMDTGRTNRKFPGYSIEALKVAVIDYQLGIHPCGNAPEGHVEAMIEEIKARENGTSLPFKVPQIT